MVFGFSENTTAFADQKSGPSLEKITMEEFEDSEGQGWVFLARPMAPVMPAKVSPEILFPSKKKLPPPPVAIHNSRWRPWPNRSTPRSCIARLNEGPIHSIATLLSGTMLEGSKSCVFAEVRSSFYPPQKHQTTSETRTSETLVTHSLTGHVNLTRGVVIHRKRKAVAPVTIANALAII